MKPIAVVTTVASKKQARAMAQALVAAKLAACAQISRIESVYAWKGAIEHGKEYRLLFKTTDESYDAVERAIRELHPTSCRRSMPSPSSMSCRLMQRGSRRTRAPNPVCA
jgi:periplasmic divalent cation tolerance protein